MINNLLLVLSCILFVLLTPAFGQSNQQLQAIDDFIKDYLPQTDVPGVAVAIVKDDKIIFERGYGLLELGKSDKVDQHTLFSVASNSKAFTAALLASLVENGEANWDDPVIDHYPSLQLFDPYATRHITIKDLLTHRSGLPTFGGDHLWIGNNLSRSDIIAKLRFLEPTAPFRSRFQYQNLMYLLAGELVPAISNTSWDDAIHKQFFEPLQMTRSNTSIKDLQNADNVAQPHEKVDGKIRAIDYDLLDNVAPAAAINSSVHDMTGWMRLQLNHGMINGDTLLLPSTIKNMHRVHFPLQISSRAKKWFDADFRGYGLGWFISQYREEKLVSHSGGMSGMISLQLLIPEEKLGVIIMTNFAPNRITRVIGYTILDRLLSLPPKDWQKLYADLSDRFQKLDASSELELQENRQLGTKPSHTLKSYTGQFDSPLSGKAAVKLENGQLVFDYNKRHVGHLEHWHFNTFRVHWRHPIFDMDSKTFLTFENDEEGNISGLTVRFYDPLYFKKQ